MHWDVKAPLITKCECSRLPNVFIKCPLLALVGLKHCWWALFYLLKHHKHVWHLSVPVLQCAWEKNKNKTWLEAAHHYKTAAMGVNIQWEHTRFLCLTLVVWLVLHKVHVYEPHNWVIHYSTKLMFKIVFWFWAGWAPGVDILDRMWAVGRELDTPGLRESQPYYANLNTVCWFCSGFCLEDKPQEKTADGR